MKKVKVLTCVLIIIALSFCFDLFNSNVYAKELKSSLGTTITGTSTGGSAVAAMYYADLPDDWVGVRQIYSLDSTDKPTAGEMFLTAERPELMDDADFIKSVIAGYARFGQPLPTTGDEQKDAEIRTWIEQMTIWVLYAKRGCGNLDTNISNALFVNGDYENGEYLEITNLTTSTGHDFSDLGINFNSYVKFMVENATLYDRDIKPQRYAKLIMTEEQKEDGDYYISGPIKASLLLKQNNTEYHYFIRNYTLEITNDVKNAIIIDKNGKEIKSTDELTTIDDIYYVKVPKESLTSENNNVTVRVVIYDGDTDFDANTSFLYTTKEGKYPIIKANGEKFKFADSLDIKFAVPKKATERIEAPNTAMNANFIIFVVGCLITSFAVIGYVFIFIKKKN